jgi:hypothetical protein
VDTYEDKDNKTKFKFGYGNAWCGGDWDCKPFCSAQCVDKYYMDYNDGCTLGCMRLCGGVPLGCRRTYNFSIASFCIANLAMACNSLGAFLLKSTSASSMLIVCGIPLIRK